jgi:hypothetical protein
VNQILAYLDDHLPFLQAGGRYRITGSREGESFGDAYVDLASEEVRLRMVRDRGQLFLDLQPVHAGDGEWYSIDLIRRLLTGAAPRSSELDADYAAFIRDNFGAIEDLLTDREKWPETVAELKRLRRLRSKEMFG